MDTYARNVVKSAKIMYGYVNTQSAIYCRKVKNKDKHSIRQSRSFKQTWNIEHLGR